MVASPARVRDLLELADIWERLGLSVFELAGWETRGRDSDNSFEVLGAHHTAAAVDVDRLLVDGRPGIPGPLCNVALHADGAVGLLAAGRANHFGVATWPSGRALGVEATGPPFPNYQQYVLLAAGFCLWRNVDPAHVLRADTSIDVYAVAGHKEVALAYGRKVNPSFPRQPSDRTVAGVLLLDSFRADVRAAIRQEDDMTKTELLDALKSDSGKDALAAAVSDALKGTLPELLRRYIAAGLVFVKKPGEPEVFAVVGETLFHVQDPAHYTYLAGGDPIEGAVLEAPEGALVWTYPVVNLPSGA